MPSPKSGKAGTAVIPANPDAALDADDAVHGDVEQIEGKFDKKLADELKGVKVKPHKPPQTEEEKEQKQSWIEIKMIDENADPVPGRVYQIILPDGETVAEGTLDEKGFAHVDGIEPGTCRITFPDLDQEAWQRI